MESVNRHEPICPFRPFRPFFTLQDVAPDTPKAMSPVHSPPPLIRPSKHRARIIHDRWGDHRSSTLIAHGMLFSVKSFPLLCD